MKQRIVHTLILVCVGFVALPGCEKEVAVASPSCAAYDKSTNEAERAELLKKCPRKGTFKPSEKKTW